MTAPSPARPARARRRFQRWATSALLAAALAGAAVPGRAVAQTGVEVYNGNWIGSAVADGPAGWPAMEPAMLRVAINGDNSEFEAEWTGLGLDDGAAVWVEMEADFERASRPGYFAPDEGDADILDGERQLWAFQGEGGLVLGRLQIDEESGKYMVFTCRLVPSETGLDATLTLSTSEAPAMSAVVTMVRR